MELVGPVGDGVRVLKKPGGGNKMHSIFEDFFGANIHFKSKLGKVVGEEGDSSLTCAR